MNKSQFDNNVVEFTVLANFVRYILPSQESVIPKNIVNTDITEFGTPFVNYIMCGTKKITIYFIKKGFTKMKKMILIMAALILTVAFTSESYAQNGKGSKKAPRTNWIDLNNDGICDNYTGSPKMNKGTTRPNFVDANGDGICDNAATGTCTGTQGVNFVDENGDGVCDNAGSATRKRAQDGTGTGTGSANGRRGGNGNGGAK